MKIRDGFVSNSSSASFILSKDILSPRDIRKIKAYFKLEEKDNTCEDWTMKESAGSYEFMTNMDNEYFTDWLKEELGLEEGRDYISEE